MSDSEWRAVLSANNVDLGILGAALAGETEVRIGFEGESAYLTGTFLDNLDDGVEVRSRAQEMAEVITGAAVPLLRLDEQLFVVSVARVHSSGKRDGWAFAQDNLTVTDRAEAVVTRDAAGLPLSPPSATLMDRIRMADAEDVIREVLYWVGRQPATSYSLWKAFELVRQAVDGPVALLATNWISAADAKRLRQALNDRRILGRESRHATGPAEPLVVPVMTIVEARELVGSIVERWLASRMPNQVD